MAIAISETPVTLREIILRDKPEEMLAASPKGTVPVLIDGDAVIDESLDVMRWALKKHDPENWLESLDDPLVAENDGGFKHHLDRYKYATRFADADPAAHRQAGAAFLEKLDKRLGAAAYLTGAARSGADIAIFPFVRQFRLADEAWFDESSFVNTRRWLAALMNGGLFDAVMKKYPLWKETGEEFAFGEGAR